jgi:hypothetical protein
VAAKSAQNPYGVENRVTPVDYTADGAPRTMGYHGFKIQIDGVTIGRITEWTPIQMSRPGTHIRELNGDTYGQPVDFVPGVEENFTLAFGRAEVWLEEIEIAFGLTNNPYALLINQNRPFVIDELFTQNGLITRHYKYVGCWFTSKNTSQFTAEGGDSIVKIDGEISFVNRQVIL